MRELKKYQYNYTSSNRGLIILYQYSQVIQLHESSKKRLPRASTWSQLTWRSWSSWRCVWWKGWWWWEGDMRVVGSWLSRSISWWGWGPNSPNWRFISSSNRGQLISDERSDTKVRMGSCRGLVRRRVPKFWHRYFRKAATMAFSFWLLRKHPYKL